MIQKKINILFYIAIFFTLSFNFSFNTIKTVDTNWFNSFQLDSEALVIGKIINSRQNGIKSHSGFLGNSDGNYYKEKSQNNYAVYDAQTGIQGVIFSALDKFLKVESKNKLIIYYCVNSVLMSLSLTILIKFFIDSFGIMSGIFCFVGTLYSPWLIVGAKNLYWIFWTHLLPLPILFVYLTKIKKKWDRKYEIFLFVIIFIMCYLKFLSGFEFASQYLITIELPIIYFSISHSWPRQKVIRIFFNSAIIGILGFFSAVLTTLIQISFLKRLSLIQSFHELFLRVAYRTGFNQENYQIATVYKKSLEITSGEVLKRYLLENKILFNFTAIEVLLCLVLLSIIYWYYSDVTNKKLLALNVVTSISFLGPISWFFLAKGHSAIHTHINYILFNMPFTVFVCFYLGAVIDDVIFKLKDRGEVTLGSNDNNTH